MSKKFLGFGKIKKFEKSEYPFFEFDLHNLKEFVEVISAYGEKYLAGKEMKDVYADIKAKKIPELKVYMFDRNESGEYADPDFVKKKFCLKLED